MAEKSSTSNVRRRLYGELDDFQWGVEKKARVFGFSDDSECVGVCGCDGVCNCNSVCGGCWLCGCRGCEASVKEIAIFGHQEFLLCVAFNPDVGHSLPALDA